MLVGVIADDFTGASDIANTLAKGLGSDGGLSTAQYVGVPESAADSLVEAGVISLKTRSLEPDLAVEQSLQALSWLQAQGCEQIIFKYCSTFDSTPEGNIGPVGEALATAMNVKAVVVCPAFPQAGRTVYQGQLFVFDQLLHESGMQNHPLTPMSDADIRRWLALQCQGSVGHVALPDVRAGNEVLTEALRKTSTDGHVFCVVDAITDEDLIRIGESIGDHALVSGGSGIAMALPRNFHRQGKVKARTSKIDDVSGAGAILAGSCSQATRGQIEQHAIHYPTLALDIEQLMSGQLTADLVVSFITDHQETYPLAYSSGTPEQVSKLQARYGASDISDTLDALFADTASALIANGYDRLVIAGGETSSAVAQRVATLMQQDAMHIGREIDPGIPVLLMGADKPIALALKSGNFGGIDFFAKAFDVMAGART